MAQSLLFGEFVLSRPFVAQVIYLCLSLSKLDAVVPASNAFAVLVSI
jgi:hypothetical protein